MPEVLTYTDQLRKRADRAAALEAEVNRLRAELATLRDAAALRALLVAILDAAPGCTVQWATPGAATGRNAVGARDITRARYKVTDYDWSAAEGRTPERFEDALDAASRYLSGETRTLDSKEARE